MIILDTTVLAYASGASHPLRQPCVSLVAAIGRGEVVATTTVEVVQELVRVYARRRGRAEAAALGRRWVTLLAPLVTTTTADLGRGLGVYETVGRLGAFDAVLAGVALERDVVALVSADRTFADVPGLPFVDVASPAFAAIVRFREP